MVAGAAGCAVIDVEHELAQLDSIALVVLGDQEGTKLTIALVGLGAFEAGVVVLEKLALTDRSRRPDLCGQVDRWCGDGRSS